MNFNSYNYEEIYNRTIWLFYAIPIDYLLKDTLVLIMLGKEPFLSYKIFLKQAESNSRRIYLLT